VVVGGEVEAGVGVGEEDVVSEQRGVMWCGMAVTI